MVSRVVTGMVAVAVAALAVSAGAQSKTTKAPAPSVHVRYVVAPTGNEARYRVREQLVGLDLPNDAVGVTKDITGALVVALDGTVVRDSSKITISVATLKSDKDRRDKYLKRRTMETDRFPIVEMVPTMLHGLTGVPAPGSPSVFEMVGDLTVRGVTKPTTWRVSASADGADVVGHATTQFTFKDFGLEQPKVAVLLSVEDTITLEYDFRFTPALDTTR